MSDIKLEKSPKEENPVVITSTLYEAGHKMPLNDAKKSQNSNFDDFRKLILKRNSYYWRLNLTKNLIVYTLFPVEITRIYI
jgi:hypothetical protein